MKIGVIGLGLIGGSIFKTLREMPEYELVGISSSVREDNISNSYDTLKDCDLVFVCTPMNATLDVLDRLESVLSQKTIVTDVCSLKGFVTKKKYTYNFIPSHPMAGTEHSGWENSFIGLFKGANWVITPINGEVTNAQEVLESVIKKLGANIIITTPEEHDEAVAYISHLPLVIAQALCANIKDNKLAQILASSGFKDTTRLALSNVEMASDMVNLNQKNIETAYASFSSSFNDLLKEDYMQKALNIKNMRKALYD